MLIMLRWNTKKIRRFCLYDQKRSPFLVQDRNSKQEPAKKKPDINQVIWNEMRKKWARPFTQTGYIRQLGEF